MLRSLTAIVLGGTSPHIELIRQLKERGYRTILADYLEDPPARRFADKHERTSTMDFDAVEALARDYEADLVISACVDQANATACYVAERLGLPHPYSYEVASQITNKGCMKRVMRDNGIPTTKYFYLGPGEEAPQLDFSYPVMVKPADSCASSGVKMAANELELASFLENARRVSRTGSTIVEEVAQGTEVSAYCYVQNGKACIVMASERLSVTEGPNKVLKCYATITPPNISDAAMKKIEKAATGIATAFGLDNTPLHVQAMCDGDGINILEFAPRVGGGISYETIRKSTGFDIISASIDSYLGQSVDLDFQEPARYCSINLLYGRPGCFDHLEGVEPLLEQGIIESIHYHKTKGAPIEDDRASASRIAAFVVAGATRQEMCERIAFAMGQLKAYDDQGCDILRSDLYCKV